MEWIFITLLIALFMYRLMPTKGIKSISTEQLKLILNDQDKVFIDVRTPAEYKGQSIRPFKNVPLGSDFSILPKDKEIVVICQSGVRSNQACKKLKKLGFQNITNVRGGIGSWRG